jgi:hypothetical protein
VKYAILIIVGILVLGGSVVMGSARADGTASVSASPYPTPTPTATVDPPASAKVRAYCLKSRARAVKVWKRYARARDCFGQRPLVHVSKRPPRAESAVVWLDAREQWIRERARLERLFRRLREKMVHPGGSSNGVRWKPLMRHVGFPEYILSTFAAIIYRESSGRQNALNASSGAAGLLQFMPQWYRGQWGYPAFNPFDPEQNLRAGYWVWRRQGLEPWAL